MSNELKHKSDDLSMSTMPLSGKLIKAVISSFCRAPYKGDDSWPDCSIGIATDSIVATDSSSAILIGESRGGHYATQRKEALLESERSSLYGDPVRFDGIAKMVDPQTGEVQPMPDAEYAIRKNLASMRPIAVVSPDALLAIAKVASAAGASSVELFQPAKQNESSPHTVVGFIFRFPPEVEHVNLFRQWDGDIEARGVFTATRSSHAKVEEDLELPDQPATDEPAISKPKRARAQAQKTEETETQVVAEVAPQPEPVDASKGLVRGEFTTPALDLLEEHIVYQADGGGYDKQILDTLRAFNLTARMAAVEVGPTVTMYEVDVPGGTSVKRVAALADDLQMQLAVKSVRIQAPIPGKRAIGIEIPNRTARVVGLRELCATHEFVDSPNALTVALGLTVSGKPVFADLASLPHLLVAGATNSGKSIGLATLLVSLLLRNGPREMRLVLIDPKQVELSLFDRLPHLMCPVVTDMREAPGVLRAICREMDRRYDLLKEAGVRNIEGYNKKAAEALPFIVVVIDELADLMMQSGGEVEGEIVRLGQKARAVGIHLVVATQRPSVDVVTGLIKANMPSRMAFAVASQIDSRVILDQNGAEKLLGRGDMLFAPISDGGRATRVQGCYVSEEEVERVVRAWRKQSEPIYALGDTTEGE